MARYIVQLSEKAHYDIPVNANNILEAELLAEEEFTNGDMHSYFSYAEGRRFENTTLAE